MSTPRALLSLVRARPRSAGRAIALKVILALAPPLLAAIAMFLVIAALIGAQIGSAACTPPGAGDAAATSATGAESVSAGGQTVSVSLTRAARQEIPREILAIYVSLSQKLDIDWPFVASIGAQESDHGRAADTNTVNSSGCVGLMQTGTGGACGDFFGTYKLDGNGDGRMDPLDPWDSVATAINGLKRGKHAPGRGGTYAQYRRAACGYYGACADGSADYANEVMARAVRYGLSGPDGEAATGTQVEVSAPASTAGDAAESPAASADAAALDAWMEAESRKIGAASPLVGLGQVFVEEGLRWGIDPRFLVAVSRHEGILGTYPRAATAHNTFGIMDPATGASTLKSFASWEENIAAEAKLLKTGYVMEGRTTLQAIHEKYSPEGAANDPGGLNSGWVAGVGQFYRSLGGDPDGQITVDGSSWHPSTEDTGQVAGCAAAAQGDAADPSGVRARIVQILQAELAAGWDEAKGAPARYGGYDPWCAFFATWVWRQAGVAIPSNAYSGFFIEWARANTTWTPLGQGSPQPGDAIVFPDTDGDGLTDHVNIVEQVLPDGRVTTIGGNQGGGAVTRNEPWDLRVGRGDGKPALGWASPVAPGQDGVAATSPVVTASARTAPGNVAIQNPLGSHSYEVISDVAGHQSRRVGPAEPTSWGRNGIGGWPSHIAEDLAAPVGTPVYAPIAGRVVYAYDRSSVCGTCTGYAVAIDSDQGVAVFMTHLGRGLLVRVGQRVRRGQQVGAIGAWFTSIPNHVHYAMGTSWARPGESAGIDPHPYL